VPFSIRDETLVFGLLERLTAEKVNLLTYLCVLPLLSLHLRAYSALSALPKSGR
jgi:hypothetical protein